MGCCGQTAAAASYSVSPSFTTLFIVFFALFQLNSCLQTVSASSSIRERTKPDKPNRTTRMLTAADTKNPTAFQISTTTTTTTSAVVTPTSAAAKRHSHRPHRHRHQPHWKTSRSISNHSSTATPTTASLPFSRTRLRHQPKLVRSYGLLSRCSNKYVRVTGRHVDAKANGSDQYALLRVETYGFGSRLKIQGDRSQSYLCFNINGKLSVRSSGKDGKCIFQEVLSAEDHFTKFQSTFASHWFVAFNKQGRSVHGDFWTKRPQQTKCRDFIKMDSIDGGLSKKTPVRVPGPDVDLHRLHSRLKPKKSRQV